MKPEKFTPIAQPEALDFYTIFLHYNIKYIHVLGYSYESDDHWANMECCGFYEPLQDFIANVKANPAYVDETYCNLNQYQGDYSAEEMADTINHYFDGHCPDAYLGWNEITMDTPCGDYVVRAKTKEK